MGSGRHDDRRSGALTGVPHGPDATLRATELALARTPRARCLVLVEGISDQIALEALAVRQGRDLSAERVVVLPIGGAHAAPQFIARLGPLGAGHRLTGLFDVGEEEQVRSGLVRGGVGNPADRRELGRMGFFLCVEDLEGELIRAAGHDRFRDLLALHGDLDAFRTLQRQPAWRNADLDAQAHRWLRAGARRHLRYARLLVDALDVEAAPRPMRAVLAATRAEPVEIDGTEDSGTSGGG